MREGERGMAAFCPVAFFPFLFSSPSIPSLCASKERATEIKGKNSPRDEVEKEERGEEPAEEEEVKSNAANCRHPLSFFFPSFFLFLVRVTILAVQP